MDDEIVLKEELRNFGLIYLNVQINESLLSKSSADFPCVEQVLARRKIIVIRVNRGKGKDSVNRMERNIEGHSVF